jgi:hypothetical protein
MPLVEFDDQRISTREEPWKVGGDFIRDTQVFGPWTWWATLTFKNRVSDEHADRSLRAWARHLARQVVDDHIGFVWVRESQPRNHFHALLAMPANVQLTWRELDDAWKHSDTAAGFVEIVKYDAARGAAYYIASKDGWTSNVACPRHRRCRRPAGCLVAHSSW